MMDPVKKHGNINTKEAESEEGVQNKIQPQKIVATFPVQDEALDDGKNRRRIRCQICPSIVLNPGMGIYKQVEFPLPHMKRQKTVDASTTETEVVKDYWVVSDVYSFENVGFSNQVGGVKYLACADCEVGPIGWYDSSANLSYVALSRVRHCDS